MQGHVVVIATLHKRLENTWPIVRRLFSESTRAPDECWLMCEDEDDYKTAHAARSYWSHPKVCKVVKLPTERIGKRYALIPYSTKINYALDRAEGDYVVYLDNNSMPHERKLELMAKALDENPGWFAVYCAQQRTGMRDHVAPADGIVKHGMCAVNYTQVMHRMTGQRWTTDIRYGNPDLADGMFWQQLNEHHGAFYPVAPELVLDTHHIPETAAEGM
jgi:hypothetical protein